MTWFRNKRPSVSNRWCLCNVVSTENRKTRFCLFISNHFVGNMLQRRMDEWIVYLLLHWRNSLSLCFSKSSVAFYPPMDHTEPVYCGELSSPAVLNLSHDGPYGALCFFLPLKGGTRILGKPDCNCHINVEHVENRRHWLEAIKLKDTYSEAKGMIISLAREKMHSCVR